MSLSKTVLVVGGSGFVGSHVAARLKEHYKVYATYHTHPIRIDGVTFLPMALQDRLWTKKLIRWVEPQAIVYCAGSNSRKWAEKNPDKADLVHATGVSTVAEACGILQSKIIYLSNPYVFDGKKGNYHEGETARPYNDFGKIKLSGENYLRSKSLNWVTIRSGPLYGKGIPTHPTFVDSMRMKLDRGKPIELSNKELQSYAPIDNLTQMIQAVIESTVKNKILHYCGLTKMSAYEFAQQFTKAFGYPENLISMPKDDKNEDEDYSLNCTQSIELMRIKALLLSEGFAKLTEPAKSS
jgi:dTDP-4-dehydrorhamnose reductase